MGADIRTAISHRRPVYWDHSTGVNWLYFGFVDQLAKSLFAGLAAAWPSMMMALKPWQI